MLLGALAAGGCAILRPEPDANGDVTVDREFRDLVERLADRSRASRPILLRRFDPRRLTAEGRILYDALGPGIDADAGLAGFGYGETGLPYSVTHRNGGYRNAIDLPPDVNAQAVARTLIRETGQIEGEASRGIIPPDFVLEPTIAAVEEMRQRTAARDDRAQIAQALEQQLASLRALQARAPSAPGVWRLPRGEEYYALTLQFHLGASVDPHEAHARALARGRELQVEADALLRGHGLTQGSVAERLRALAAEEAQLYPASNDGAARAVSDMRQVLLRLEPIMAGAFAGMTAPAPEIRRLAPDQELNGTRGRRQGSVYWVDLGAIRSRPRWTLPSVVFHETVPGHALQSAAERAANAPDLQQRVCNGYSEGWSSYAEQVAAEHGAYADDPLARVGYLQWMLFRIARVVADTGMHALRWSREETIAQMRDLQGDSIAFVSIEEDVGRIAAQPGFAAAQGLAMMHIGELRERLRRTRGFDLSAFHRAMLRHGPLSPPGLEQAARAALGA